MESWLRTIREVVDSIHKEVVPMIGSREAAEIVNDSMGGDGARRIDKKAEDVAIRILKKNGRSCVLVSEELGTKTIGRHPKYFVVLDGIDGTTNAVRGLPFFCSSAAVSKSKMLDDVFAAVVMNLNTKETYYAQRKKGAYLNGKRIETSSIDSLKEALISIDLIRTRKKDIRKLESLITEARHIRYFGAVALELCNVAAGITDAYVDVHSRLRMTDFAGGYLILREAGGIMTDAHGSTINSELKATETTSLVATANGRLSSRILNLIGRRRPVC